MVDRYNYLCVLEFLAYLENTKGLQNKSTTRYRTHLNHLLLWADDIPFPSVMTKDSTFLVYVRRLTNKDGSDISLDTKRRIMETAQRFFHWAKFHREADFKDMPMSWIDDLQMPRVEYHAAENKYVSLEEILCIARMEVDPRDLSMLRDRAAAVMLFLSGMRAGAFASTPIKAFDMNKFCVYQWPKEYGVKTKNNKKAVTYLLPIPELLEVVMGWHGIVSASLPPTALWYSPIRNDWGENPVLLEAAGSNRKAALNKRLRIVFRAAGLPYKSAHKFRHGHAVYGLKNSRDMQTYKAISQNLMHKDISITDGIYAPLLADDVGNLISTLGMNVREDDG